MKKRYDERRTMFSRARLKPSTQAYDEFYRKYPELRLNDDQVREVFNHDHLRESSLFKQLLLPLYEDKDAWLKKLYERVETIQLGNRITPPSTFHKNIKEITKHFGADDVGIVRLQDRHYYTHKGGVSGSIGCDDYGQEVKQRYHTAIVFVVHMTKNMINRAPFYESMLATSKSYMNMAWIGAQLAGYLKKIGYQSMFQSEAYYLTPMVPLADDAGLGEIGMANHLVHPKYGNAIRIGAVLTTLQLTPDQPKHFGLEAFCKRCALCLMNCPSNSITPHQRIVNGKTLYQFTDHTCYKLWLKTGTDCSTCIQSCPFTQGIIEKDLLKMQKEPDYIDQVIKKHLKKYTRRNLVKTKLPIVDLEE